MRKWIGGCRILPHTHKLTRTRRTDSPTAITDTGFEIQYTVEISFEKYEYEVMRVQVQVGEVPVRDTRLSLSLPVSQTSKH